MEIRVDPMSNLSDCPTVQNTEISEYLLSDYQSGDQCGELQKAWAATSFNWQYNAPTDLYVEEP